MIYVYRRGDAESADKLARELRAARVWEIPALTQSDKLICWGESAGPIALWALNGISVKSKLTDAKVLRDAGVPTIEISEINPAEPPRLDVIVFSVAQAKAGVEQLRDYITRWSNATSEGWLGRMTDHSRGADLLNPSANPDFWVKKEKLVGEVRVHSFLGKSIGAGRKVKTRPDAHEWIRSIDSGWDESYGADRNVTNAHRELAHKAVKALSLDFGAVDIGERADGSLLVLEVNRAPGLLTSGGSSSWLVSAYANAIRTWIGQ